MEIVIAQTIKEARLHAGLSQRQLAALINVPQSFVAKIELGERSVSVVDLINVCKALKVAPAAMLNKIIMEDETL